MDTLDYFRNDYDWKCVFAYACGDHVSTCLGSTVSPDPFTIDDVERVIAFDNGENDGASWITILFLKDKRFAFLTAGCDYTGWGCQESGNAVISHNLINLLQFGLGLDDRQRLYKALPNDIITFYEECIKHPEHLE